MTSFQANLLLPKGEPRSTHMFFTSPNIKDQSYLDIKYTKYGENRMPSFHWDPVDNASYYALFCVDITRPWNHLYIPYISISKSSISLNAENSIVGINSFGNYGYDGPLPPPGSGRHTYIFYLFAIQTNKNKNEANIKKSIHRENTIVNIESFIQSVQDRGEKILAYGEIRCYFEKE